MRLDAFHGHRVENGSEYYHRHPLTGGQDIHWHTFLEPMEKALHKKALQKMERAVRRQEERR